MLWFDWFSFVYVLSSFALTVHIWYYYTWYYCILFLQFQCIVYFSYYCLLLPWGFVPLGSQRRRHAPRATATSTAIDLCSGSALWNTPPAPPINTGADESILPPTLLADLVTKVTTEVTKQLAPLLSSHGNTDPGPLTEVSLGNTPALVTSSESTAYQINLQHSYGTQPSSLEPAVKPKKIHNIEMWLSAFHIFIGVYTSKYPHESRLLWNTAM